MESEQAQKIAIVAAIAAIFAVFATGRLPRWLRVSVVLSLASIACAAGLFGYRYATHPVTLTAQVVGAGKSPRGRSIVAYAATATIDRTQWGMSYGPMIVGNSIDISVNIEADAPQ